MALTLSRPISTDSALPVVASGTPNNPAGIAKARSIAPVNQGATSTPSDHFTRYLPQKAKVLAPQLPAKSSVTLHQEAAASDLLAVLQAQASYKGQAPLILAAMQPISADAGDSSSLTEKGGKLGSLVSSTDESDSLLPSLDAIPAVLLAPPPASGQLQVELPQTADLLAALTTAQTGNEPAVIPGALFTPVTADQAGSPQTAQLGQASNLAAPQAYTAVTERLATDLPGVVTKPAPSLAEVKLDQSSSASSTQAGLDQSWLTDQTRLLSTPASPPKPDVPLPTATFTQTLALAAGSTLQQQQLQTALGEHLQWQVNQQIQQANIQLHPAELGSITITLHLEPGKTVVHLAADVPATQQLLQQTTQDLKEKLVLNHNGAVQVDVSSQGDQQRRQAFRQQDDKQTISTATELNSDTSTVTDRSILMTL